MLPSVGVEPLQFVGIDAAHHPWSEQSLKEAADPACAVPGRGDLHEGHVALRVTVPPPTESTHLPLRARAESGRSCR